MLTVSGREIPESDTEVSAQKVPPSELSNKNIVIAISLGKYLSGGKSGKGGKEVLSEIEILRGYLDLVNNAHYDCLLAKKEGIKGVIFYVGDEIHSGDFHIIARDPATVISGNSTPAISDEELRICLKKMDLTFLKGCDLSDPKQKGIAEKHLALEFEKIFIPYTRKLGAVYLNKIKESKDAKDSWNNLAVPYKFAAGPYWKKHEKYSAELKAAETSYDKAEETKNDVMLSPESEQAIKFKKLIDNDVARHQKSYGYLIRGAEKRIKANAAAIGITIPDELSFENMSKINCRYFHLSEVAQNRCLRPGTRVFYRGSSPESLEPTCNDKEYDLRWIDMRIESASISKKSNSNNIYGRSSHLEQSYVRIYPKQINQLRSYLYIIQEQKKHEENLRRLKEETEKKSSKKIVPEVKPKQKNNRSTDNIIFSLQNKKDPLIVKTDEKYSRATSVSIPIPKTTKSPLLNMTHFVNSAQERKENDMEDDNIRLSPPRSAKMYYRGQALISGNAIIENPDEYVSHFLQLFNGNESSSRSTYSGPSNFRVPVF